MSFPPRTMIYVDYDNTLVLNEDSEGRVYRNEPLVKKLLEQQHCGIVIWSTRGTEDMRALISKHFPELFPIATAIIQKPMIAIDDSPSHLLPDFRIKTPQQFLEMQKIP